MSGRPPGGTDPGDVQACPECRSIIIEGLCQKCEGRRSLKAREAAWAAAEREGGRPNLEARTQFVLGVENLANAARLLDDCWERLALVDQTVQTANLLDADSLYTWAADLRQKWGL